MSDAPDKPAVPKDNAPRLPLITELGPKLTVLNQHLGLTSVLVALFTMFFSLTFLYGYLAVFDSTLIWVIQSSDILNFALVGLGVIVGAYTIVQTIVVPLYGLVAEPTHKRSWTIIGGISVALVILLPFILDIRSAKPEYEFHGYIAGSVALSILFLIFGYRTIKNWRIAHIGALFWWFFYPVNCTTRVLC
jgi:hypothetical protein